MSGAGDHQVLRIILGAAYTLRTASFFRSIEHSGRAPHRLLRLGDGERCQQARESEQSPACRGLPSMLAAVSARRMIPSLHLEEGANESFPARSAAGRKRDGPAS